MAKLRVTILGSGSSGGVPRLGGQWGACDPENPRNRRQRCSVLVEKIDGADRTRVLIDTSPDMRAQLLAAEVGHLDGVVFTHAHADHTHGIDDLRMIVFNRKSRLPVWADAETANALSTRFAYAFIQPEGSSYPPILDLHLIDRPFEVAGAAGPIPFAPLEVVHGRINALGFRMADIAYLPDVSDIPDEAWKSLDNLSIWILDALRYEPHPTHTHVARSLEWMERARPKRGILTNLHNAVDYETLNKETPGHIEAAYDGMFVEVDF